jgi:chlorobactene glucosyltransferase
MDFPPIMVLDIAGALIVTAIAVVLIAVSGVTILNVIVFPRLQSRNSHGAPQREHVTVCIPARDESAIIGRTIRELLGQQGVPFDVLLLDDASTDGTAALAVEAANGDARVRVITGQRLPSEAGWFGKNWACWQLAQEAQGALLLFADADVRWQPGSLRALIDESAASKAGLVTCWPTQQTVTWGERMVVPLMALVIYSYLPLPLVVYTSWSPFAAANGQCLLFTREAYDRSGGHQAVRNSIVEDIDLARLVKRAGLRLWMCDGGGLIGCRMYTSWPAVRDGFAKNIIAGYGGTGLMLLGTLFHWLIYLGPWIWLIGGMIEPAWRAPFPFPELPLALIGIGILNRMLSAAATGQRLFDALSMPLAVLLMSRIAAQALYWQARFGGPRWKGRTLTRRP